MFTKNYHYDFYSFFKDLETFPELEKHLKSFKETVFDITDHNGDLIYFNFHEILDDENYINDWDDDIRAVLRFVKPYVNEEDLILNVWW